MRALAAGLCLVLAGCSPLAVREQQAVEKAVSAMGFVASASAYGRAVGEVVEVLADGQMRLICATAVSPVIQPLPGFGSATGQITARAWLGLAYGSIGFSEMSLQAVADTDILTARCSDACRHSLRLAAENMQTLYMVSQALRGTVRGRDITRTGVLGVVLDSYLPSLLVEDF